MATRKPQRVAAASMALACRRHDNEAWIEARHGLDERIGHSGVRGSHVPERAMEAHVGHAVAARPGDAGERTELVGHKGGELDDSTCITRRPKP